MALRGRRRWCRRPWGHRVGDARTACLRAVAHLGTDRHDRPSGPARGSSSHARPPPRRPSASRRPRPPWDAAPDVAGAHGAPPRSPGRRARQAPGLRVRHGAGAARLTPARTGRRSTSRVTRAAGRATRSAASARCSSTSAARAARRSTPAGRRPRCCSRRSTTASTSSASTRAASARASPAIDCKVNQETDGPTRSRSPRRRRSTCDALVAKHRRYVAALPRAQRRILPYVVDGQRRPRHGRAARGGRRRPKLSYLGFSYGTFLGATYATPVPATATARSCSTARSTPTHWVNRPARGLGRADRGLRAGARPLLPGLRGATRPPARSAAPTRTTPTTSSLERIDATPLPAGGAAPAAGRRRRPLRGDRPGALRQAALARARRAALAPAEAGDGTLVRVLVDALLRRDLDDGRLRPRPATGSSRSSASTARWPSDVAPT